MIEMMSPLLAIATFIGAAISRFSAGTLAKPAPRPNTPPKKPIAANAARPAAVRRVRQSMRMPAAGSSNSPLNRSSSPSASDSTTPKSAAFIAQIMKAMAITVAPSAICRRSVATDSPTTAPVIEAIEPASASGMTSRRFAIPVRNSTGPAASVPDSAHEIEMEREKAADDGHEQHAAADARQHGDDADDEAHGKEGDRPDPPWGCAVPRGERRRGICKHEQQGSDARQVGRRFFTLS